jgi:hypothetical protein
MGDGHEQRMSKTDPRYARRADRVAIDAEVVLRRSAQLNYRVRAFDASPYGCKLEFVERPELEERVWVKFDGLDALEALVVRVEGFVAGVEFVRPMHQAVFDALTPRLG